MKKVTINIIFAILMMMVWQVTSAFASGTFMVNDGSTGNTCNGSLSLDEAVTLARFGEIGRNLTPDEKNQISGATFFISPYPPPSNCLSAIWLINDFAGLDYADDIKFTNDVGTINGGIILGRNDDIDGLKPNGQKVILNGSGIVGNVNGIKLLDTDPTGSQVRNLVVQNFPANGILAAHLNGAIFEGLDIHGNGGSGLVITYPIGGTANSRNVTVGGDQPQHRNLVYGNNLHGIEINALSNSDHNGSQNIVVKNNYIGTSDGTSDNGNNSNGIELNQAFGVTIGDATGATRNVISGNNNDGIQIKGSGATGNTIIGNFIGTDSSSGVRLGNGSSGIGLVQGAGDNADIVNIPANKIGLPGLGNVISGNNFGIYVVNENTSNNWIQANYIGTNVGGNTDLGNTADGILLGFGTYDNRVGDTGTGEGNLIAFNRNGVLADGGIRNFIKRNRMFSNDNLGIDLSPPSGVNPNDAGDGDTGPNNLQNYPVITYVNAQNNSVTIQGTFNSAGNLTYTLEFFGNTAADSTGFGEGRNYIGSTTVTTNASGNATFNVPFSVSIATVGAWITATATDSSNNTSEFSQARSICADLSLSPAATTMSNAGGAGNFTVVNSVGCSYTAQSNASWITVGTVSMGTVNFAVAANSGIQRSGTITISYNNGAATATRTFTVNQTNGCTFSLSPTSMNIAAAGGNNSFNIIASDATCTFIITPNAGWLTTILPNGSGNTQVFFTATPNTGPARSGTITAAGQTFTVNQSGVGCTYSLSPTNQSVTAAGTSLSFSLITTAGCTWTAVSNAAWITVIGGANGTGNGTISYTVATNTGPARTGTITAGGQLFTINQASGCSFSLNPTSQSFSTAGGNGSFNVIASNGACTWTATETATWITITGGGSGTGNGTVSFSVDATSGLSRAAFIVVGGQSFTVSQANGCTFSVSPISLNIAAAGGNSSFNVTTSDGSCGWTALSNSSWITGVAGGFQFGNQTITFAVAANTGAARTGTIAVAGQTFTVNQASGCVYSLSPSSQQIPGSGGTGSFAVTTPAGCTWSVPVNPETWITVTSGSSGSGNGTINYTVAPNPGNPRSGNFLVGGLPVSIIQASQCTYTANPASATFPTSGGSSSFTVTNASGCTWQVNRGLNTWITITSSVSNTGNQTVTFTVQANASIPRNGTIVITENTVTMQTIVINQAGKQTKFDFDGDSKTDIGIFRPTGGEWWYLRSSDGQNQAFPFGLSSDKLVPADFTGDGKNDVAFWRPSTGFWYVMRSEDNTFYAFPFGANGDIPAPGDYDGDGIADVAVFRPSNTTWFINKSSGGTTIQQFGAIGDLPNVADYDGDGKTDIGIFRPNGTNGAEWWILRSSNGSVFATQFGNSTDKAIPADFTGDGKADIAFWRPASGFWYVLRSEDFSYYAAPFGALGDVPAVGDYDGDGKSDFAVFRPSNNTWFIQRSTAGTLIQGFGNAGDVPIPSVFTP